MASIGQFVVQKVFVSRTEFHVGTHSVMLIRSDQKDTV